MGNRDNLKLAPRCGAKARSRGGLPCMQVAMANGRCQYHGGKNPIKHGRYSKQTEKKRREESQQIKAIRKSLTEIKGAISGKNTEN